MFTWSFSIDFAIVYKGASPTRLEVLEGCEVDLKRLFDFAACRILILYGHSQEVLAGASYHALSRLPKKSRFSVLARVMEYHA